MKRTAYFNDLLRTRRQDRIWLPVGFWALFVILTALTRHNPYAITVTTAYFGAALPLIHGVLAAYAVLDDPALELQFTAPRGLWRLLAERLGVSLALAAVSALAYQLALAALGVDLSFLGGVGARQLAWLVPTLAMMGLGSLSAFALRQSAGGAALVGLVWLFQIMLHDWFLNSAWGQYLLLFMGSNYADHPALRGNQAVLILLAGLCLWGGARLLRRTERYL